MRLPLAVLAVSLLAVTAAGCGGAEQPAATVAPAAAAPGEGRPPASAAATGCEPGSLRPLRSERIAYAALAPTGVTAYRRPGGAALRVFGPVNENGVATVLGVLAARIDDSCRPRWYRVQLPLRPNGATGWVRAGDVELATVRSRIEVDLSARRVTLLRDGAPVLTATAAIGSGATPTPTGSYYVNQRLRAPDPTGAFGPGAVGISAFSPALPSWPQGGPIAIHGTNAPDLLGFAVSHGCVRVRNDELERIYRLAEEGTPVIIRA